MNSAIQLAKSLLDHAGATYVITHSSLKSPVFSEESAVKPAKLVASKPTKTTTTRRYASKWRAMLADIPVGRSKELPTPSGVSGAVWQMRVAAAASSVLGKGHYTTKLLPDGSVRITRK